VQSFYEFFELKKKLKKMKKELAKAKEVL